MMNELKTILQDKLSHVEGLSSGVAKPDDLVEDNEIYYGYELTYKSSNNSVDYSTTDYDITITGRLVSKNKSLSIMDEYAQSIADILKELRFDYTMQDVIAYDNIKKKIINGSASMNDATYLIR